MFQPHYLPHNQAAERLTNAIARELNLSLSGRTGQKHEIIIASFLSAVKHRDENTIVWRTGKDNQDSDYWAFIPNVGQSVSLKICTPLSASSTFLGAILGAVLGVLPVMNRVKPLFLWVLP